MPLVSEIGDAVLGEVHVEWKIPDFFSLSEKVDDFYQSPAFSFAGEQWYMTLYPNGQTTYSSSGSVGLYIYRKVSGPPKTVYYTFGIKSNEGVEKKNEQETEFSPKNNAWGSAKFWSRSELRNLKSTLVTNNELTVTCVLRCKSPSSVKVSLCNGACKVSRNMKSILAEGKRADFTLKLGDREWPVHKVILESRCEYFANMFRHEWVENTVGEVTFNDIEVNALDRVLDFVYTDVVEDMSVKNVCEIYVAAHKFLLDDLKALCIECMKKNMSMEIVCKVLVIADTYQEKNLNESAVEYFMRESVKIMGTEEWKELKKYHLSVVAELLEETTKREAKKRTK